MSTRPDESSAPYLPARYRQQVKAKKQRRIYKKLVAAGIVIVVVIVACLLLLSMFPGPVAPLPTESPVTPVPTTGDQTPAPEVMATVIVTVTPGFVMGSGISVLRSPDLLPLDNAVSFLFEDYPEKTYRLISANLTDRYPDHLLYEFGIQPAGASQEAVVTVFEDAKSGDPYTPGQEDARVTAGQAQDLVRDAFSSLPSDRVRVRYSTGSRAGNAWNFALVRGTSPVLAGTLDADTGLISSFARIIQKPGRPAEPVLDITAAQKIADRYISDRNGPVSINMSEGSYSPLGSASDPIAGQYVLVYNRIVNDIPCDTEGFIVGVDAANGEITTYERNWNAPDIAFSAITEQLVLRRDATFAVLRKAQETYPESVSGLRILSAEVRWKDQPSSDTNPRPGTIPLAWKVVFDDDFIRSNATAQPAVAWIDVQSGSFLDFMYRH